MTQESRHPGQPELWIELPEIGGGSAPPGGLQLTSAVPLKTTAKLSDEMLAGIGETLKKLCQMVSSSLQDDERPDELVVKFGLKLGTKGGLNIFLLTEFMGEATLAIEAKWSKPKNSTVAPK